MLSGRRRSSSSSLSSASLSVKPSPSLIFASRTQKLSFDLFASADNHLEDRDTEHLDQRQTSVTTKVAGAAEQAMTVAAVEQVAVSNMNTTLRWWQLRTSLTPFDF